MSIYSVTYRCDFCFKPVSKMYLKGFYWLPVGPRVDGHYIFVDYIFVDFSDKKFEECTKHICRGCLRSGKNTYKGLERNEYWENYK